MEVPKDSEPISHHVLLVAFSAQGHINPMLRLGRRLLSHGLRVTLATTEIAGRRMLRSSSSAVSGGIDLRFFSDGLPLDFDRKANLDHYMTTLAASGPTNLDNLIAADFPAGGRRRLAAVVTNPFVPWAADVAAARGVPAALLWIQPSAIFSIYYRFYNKLGDFPTSEDPNRHVAIPGLPVLATRDLPSFVLPSNGFGSIQDLFSRMFSNMGKFDWVLGNTFRELERHVADSPLSESDSNLAVTPVGPLVPPSLLGEPEPPGEYGFDMWAHDDSSVAFLDRQATSTVIYVSFGSMTVLSKTQMENVATALIKSTSPFLWVVKPPENPSGNPPEKNFSPEIFFPPETKNRGLIVPWCPQTKVLSHPSVSCFVTHCGWNSILESVAAGVPVIGCPQWTDQPTNAKLVTDVFGIGLRIEGPGITSEGVLKCIEEMRGPRYREFKDNVEGLRRAAGEAVAEGGSSDREIRRFVEEIVGRVNCGDRKFVEELGL